MILLVEDNRDGEELALRAPHRAKETHETVATRDGSEALDHRFAAVAPGLRSRVPRQA